MVIELAAAEETTEARSPNGHYRFWVVPHTHWDREWYMPFEDFQMRLAVTVDEVLDVLENDPSFSHFTLDGQAIVLEDYLQIRPWQEPRLRRLLAEGRIEAGPFYVLPDTYLVGQESLVRNLIIGRQVCERYGASPMEVWYEPDTFGHVAQIPQLANGVGINTYFMDAVTIHGASSGFLSLDMSVDGTLEKSGGQSNSAADCSR